MRQHVCKRCGKIYLTDKPDSSCCPACAAEVRRGRAKPERLLGKAEHKNPQSGVPGITWHKKTGRWQLVIKGKYCGLYDTVEDAVAAMDEKNPLP